MHVNGKLTRGANIGDLGGLNVAYAARTIAITATPDAMARGFTRDQRFFLTSAADWRELIAPAHHQVLLIGNPHAPPQFCATASPLHMPAISHAFGCKAGDALCSRPQTAASVW